MTLYDVSLNALDGRPLELSSLRGNAVLVVNVASKCGLTPQYEGLEKLHRQFAGAGFTVLGAPCNQFAGQEPGSAEDIAEFCSTKYQVSFPLTEKLDTNGQRRHPLFTHLVGTPDDRGDAGDVQWNFEKFLVGPTGAVVRRFRPPVAPEAPELIEAVQAHLPVWNTAAASQVVVGDTVRVRGQVLRVGAIDPAFMGRSEMIAFIEDEPHRWLKLPVPASTEVEVLAPRPS